MQIIEADSFNAYRKASAVPADEEAVNVQVREIIEAVRNERDAALRRYALRFEKCCPEQFEVPFGLAEDAWKALAADEGELAAAMELAARHIVSFAELQRRQFAGFETEIEPGLFAGQKVIPVEKAAVYVPAGRFPLFSSVLMGMIPALAAGVDEIVLASPPLQDGFPDRHILAAAALAVRFGRTSGGSTPRIFALGGAQAIAALALGTETVPGVSVIVGPGNKYVAAAKRLLFGEVGIDFVAGPTDVLVIAGEDAEKDGTDKAAERIAADMLAQAEHDPDARARALVPCRTLADKVSAALEKQLATLPEASRQIAAASLEAGGLVIVYKTREEAVRIANAIAPEHLELHSDDPACIAGWTSGNGGFLKNYGSLFLGSLAAEVLGDYSAGINHTLPTSGSARFTGGLSVRHFLKTVTTLRCVPGSGFDQARKAAECMGRAEGLFAHAASAAIRTP